MSKESKSSEAKPDPKAHIDAANEAETQDVRDHHATEALSGGREAVAAAPKVIPGKTAYKVGKKTKDFKPAVAGGEHLTKKDLAEHPVEQAKAVAREEARKFTNDMHGDGTNLTPTQRAAMRQTHTALDHEEEGAPEPGRGIEHSVGTERKYGLRTAAPDSDRVKSAEAE